MQITTCPLDCFDSCSIIVDDEGNLKGNKNHPITQGYLCHHLNNYHKFPRIKKASFNGTEIELDKALDILSEKLSQSKNDKVLYFKGSGNLGSMQSITKNFFAQYGAVLTKGGLCEDAGTYGIEEGRGSSLVLSPNIVKDSEIVIVWGRNCSVTNSHMLPALKGKTLIVIDPRVTTLAKQADLHIQIKPRRDIYLALLLARVAYMEQMEDVDFIEKRCQNFDNYLDLITGIQIRELIDKAGVSLSDVGEVLSIIKNKKVSILVGIGVQKYDIGHSVLRAIDSFAAMLGLFGKVGCGVGYIDDSSYGFKKPFKVEAKHKVAMQEVDFGKFDVSFIQGSNPMTQLPCTLKVKEGLEKSKFVVYFGLYENETSKMADLVIPAKDFLEKEDLKLSYGHEYIGYMPKIFDNKDCISEYEICSFLLDKFGYESLLSEREYIDEIVTSNSFEKDGFFASKSYEKLPYEEKFHTKSGKFEFFDDFDDDFDEQDGEFYLLAVKQNKSLNSQFVHDDFLKVPPSLSLKDGDIVKLNNKKYSCEYEVRVDESLRDDCLALYSGGKYSNFLTPNKSSQEGYGAIYQEIKVNLEKA
ncbi:MAG: molybdopterin-dependent oxidoreductase [Sulfurospirillaceae bacterium]|nr:molybdopterin-dependent oxidoreductase [Sulfurospirillaceae bacterium]